jgi:hypothetical protein
LSERSSFAGGTAPSDASWAEASTSGGPWSSPHADNVKAARTRRHETLIMVDLKASVGLRLGAGKDVETIDVLAG